ncbi:stonustoxin subunit beta-like [Aulostomus maculatus]
MRVAIMSDTFSVTALGQPFTLGMLYDARKDELIPGGGVLGHSSVLGCPLGQVDVVGERRMTAKVSPLLSTDSHPKHNTLTALESSFSYTLWDDADIQKNMTESPQRSSQFQITSSDSIEDKSTMLNIEASLKASFMSGMVEVGGSAKYLNDQKKFKNQSRVTFQYKATTHFKQLLVNSFGPLNSQQKALIEKNVATHVVTGIVYGANAFFVFDSQKVDASCVQDIQGSMEAVINKVPSFNLEGKVDIKLTEEEKAVTNKFTCKFFGDLLLENNPATFEDAVKTYVELPKLLGENGENAAPVKVWLMPLKTLHSRAIELMAVLSVGVVRKAQDALEDGRQIEMRCNDCLDDRVTEHFPEIRRELSEFQKLCNYYMSSLRQTMAEKLPAIREGKEDESSLEAKLDAREHSPFSHARLTKWMDNKEREINIVRSCVDMVKETNTKIVRSSSELDQEVLAPGVNDALCFVFTSLETPDPCLEAMTEYLDSGKEHHSCGHPWYFSNAAIISVRKKAKEFLQPAKALMRSSSVKFFMTATPNKNYTGATIYHYRDGILVSENFSKPANIPPVRTIRDRRDLIWYATDLNPDPRTACNSLFLSDGNKRVTYRGSQKYPDLPERFDLVPQVLCEEPLSGQHYWEIEKGGKIALALAYRSIERKGRKLSVFFGFNNKSWCFAVDSKLTAMHNMGSTEIPVSSTGINTVAVYLDWDGGTLSLYSICAGKLTHLHTFDAAFTGPVYPGFYFTNANDYVALSWV